MALIKRLDKGAPLTAVEMDANLQYLEDSISAGTSGVSGTSGSSGSSGTRGTSGTSGSSGTSGAGTSGSSGTSGIGTSGSSGTSGISGAGSTSGTSGISGTSGSSGTSGISGAGSTSGTSGSSGTSLALSLFDGDLTRLTGITNITLSGLSLSPSGSNGATINNLGGGGGGGSTINVASGSTTISSVSTLRVDADTMTLTNNGGGTATIGISGGGGTGSSGSDGTSGSSGNSISLSIIKGITSITGVQSITLTGSIFLENSGSNGALLRVDDSGGAPVILNGVVSSSQQIEDFDTFAVKNSANRFVGNQEITGSLISTTTITANDLYVANAPNFAVPEGNVIIGGSGSRISFLSTSSLTTTAAISVFGGETPYTNINTVKFSNDFTIQTSGSGVVVVSTLSGSVGGGGLTSGSGFPFSGSAVITGSLEVTGNVTASAFAITSVGVPTIESATNLNLTAGGAVVVSSSPIRLSTFTDAQTGSITAQNGDMIYNSTTHKFMGYASGSWVQLH